MTNTSLERLTWRVIYGGLFLLMLGLWLPDSAALLGLLLTLLGGLLVAAGAVMVWVRSRRPDDGATVPGKSS